MALVHCTKPKFSAENFFLPFFRGCTPVPEILDPPLDRIINDELKNLTEANIDSFYNV
jgi:hypothetical protein